MIEKWELAHFPFEKDSLRYKVRIRGTEDDLKQLFQVLPAACGRPFVTLSQDYNWAFYVYALSNANKDKALEIFKSFSPNGKVIESPTLTVSQELPPMLEDVLEAAAKNLVNPSEMQVPSPPSSPSSSPAMPSFAQVPVHSGGTQAALASVSTALPSVSGSPVSFSNIAMAPLNPQYVFSEFIVGPNNRFTHAAAQAIIEKPGEIYNPFIIYGGVGLGKTHMMQAIGHVILSRNPQTRLLYLSTDKFMSQVIEAIRTGSINYLRDQYRMLDLLLIDDIQFLSGSESTQEEFFHIFNSLHEMKKQIIITSDRSPKLLTTLEDRLRSRFEWGLFTDLKLPNLETRVAILKKKAELMGLNLNEEILLFVAGKMKSNIRELEGVLKKIYAYTTLAQETVDLEFVQNMLGHTEPSAAEDFSIPPSESKNVPKMVSPAVSSTVSTPSLQPLSPPPAAPPPPILQPEKKSAEAQKPANSGKVESDSLMRALGISKSSPQAKSVTEPVKEPPVKSPPLSTPPSPPKPVPGIAEVKKIEEKQPIIPPSKPIAPLPIEAVKAAHPAPEIPPIQPPAKAAMTATPPTSPPVPSPTVTPVQIEKPVSAIPPAPSPEPASVAPPVPEPAPPESEEDVDPTLRPVNVVCFYPKGQEAEFGTVKHKFHDIIKKHKLKIRLSRVSENPYDYEGKIDYAFFPTECKARQCPIALVLGPPPSPILSEDDFAGTLNALLDDEQLTLQFIPLSELTKDYRYLNCALDLSLSLPTAGDKK